MNLSFDEWNVWYHTKESDKKIEYWLQAPPRVEDIFTFEDALLVGGLLISLLNHADRVKIACLAQLVNVIAPIMTTVGGDAYRQTIYYPFYYTSVYGRGDAIKVNIEAPKFDCKEYTDVPMLDSVAVVDKEKGELTLFVLNRSVEEDLEVEIDLRTFDVERCIMNIALEGSEFGAVNSVQHPDNVVPTDKKVGICSDGYLKTVLNHASWNMLRFQLKEEI